MKKISTLLMIALIGSYTLEAKDSVVFYNRTDKTVTIGTTFKAKTKNKKHKKRNHSADIPAGSKQGFNFDGTLERITMKFASGKTFESDGQLQINSVKKQCNAGNGVLAIDYENDQLILHTLCN